MRHPSSSPSFSSTTRHRGQPKLDKFFCQLGGLKPSLAPRLIFTNHSKLVDFERSLHRSANQRLVLLSHGLSAVEGLHPHTVRFVLGVGVQDRDRNAEHATLPFGPPGVPLFSFHLLLGPEREPQKINTVSGTMTNNNRNYYLNFKKMRRRDTDWLQRKPQSCCERVPRVKPFADSEAFRSRCVCLPTLRPVGRSCRQGRNLGNKRRSCQGPFFDS